MFIPESTDKREEVKLMLSSFSELAADMAEYHPIPPISLMMSARWMSILLKSLVAWGVLSAEEVQAIVDEAADKRLAELNAQRESGDDEDGPPPEVMIFGI